MAGVGTAGGDPGELRIGVDLGGTKIEAVVGEMSGAAGSGHFEIAVRRRIPTPVGEPEEARYEAILGAVAELIRGVAHEAGGSRASLPRIGIGMPGSVTRARREAPISRVKNSNTTALNGRPFRDDLVARLGIDPGRIAFANDANCFAVAEARLGAAREAAVDGGVVFGAILGTGTGGGLVFDGRVWDGLQGIGGEWGHTSLFPHGTPGEPIARPCYCGQRGCVERYLAGPSIERDYAARAGEQRKLSEIVERRNDDPHAAAAVETFLDAFGRAVANLIDVLDPVAIVLGGGVSNLALLYDEGVARVRGYVFNDELLTPIVKNRLGDSAGVIGAALL